MHPEVTKARARVASLTHAVRKGKRAKSELDDARRELAQANITAYVQQTLDAAPPLTTEQRTKLAELLSRVSPGGGQP